MAASVPSYKPLSVAVSISSPSSFARFRAPLLDVQDRFHPCQELLLPLDQIVQLPEDLLLLRNLLPQRY